MRWHTGQANAEQFVGGLGIVGVSIKCLLHKLIGHLEFIRSRSTAKCGLPSPRQALRTGCAAFAQDAHSEPFRRLNKRGVVHQRQRGERRVADRALGGALLAGGRVKCPQHRV